MTAHYDISLNGIQADSLLGFMAALGTLRAAQACHDGPVRLSWQRHGSSWCPVLRSSFDTLESLVEALAPWLHARHGSSAVTFAPDLKVPVKHFASESRKAAESWLDSNDYWNAAMLAAFGCGSISNDAGDLEDTAFRTMSGAGHQHFLGFMDTLAKETTSAHLHEALAGPWRYADPSPIMRWDSLDDRRYALRWDEPSKDPVRTVRGANRLAIESLPFFPVIPVIPVGSSRVVTTAFTGRRSHDTFVSWPVWSGFLSCDVISSLIASPQILADPPRVDILEEMGVAAVFRSQRITLGKYRNFTPAACV